VCSTHEAALLDLSPQRHKDTKDTKEEGKKDLRLEIGNNLESEVSGLKSHVFFVSLCLRGYFQSIQSGFISGTHCKSR